jgi:hypothetical protein
VFVGPTGAGDRAVQRIDLATGRRELLHAGDGRLRPLGDGAAALLVQGNSAWLIEADREELLADDVSHVLTTPAPRRRQPVRQDDLAVLALSTDGGSFTLRVLDLRTRRLATLSDRLYHAPRLDHPFAHDDCGQAWTARRAGAVGEGLLQDGRHLFFVEPQTETGPATMWVVPVDLSAPPRRVADLAGHPVGCHAPLASPDGARLAFAEDGFDGQTRITIARP